MQWLAGIFESTSDQARLVTTMIAAIIAISVVLLTHWFSARRARKDTLIKKIEEIYSAVSDEIKEYLDGAKKHLDKINILFLGTFDKLSVIMSKTMH